MLEKTDHHRKSMKEKITSGEGQRVEEKSESEIKRKEEEELV